MVFLHGDLEVVVAGAQGLKENENGSKCYVTVVMSGREMLTSSIQQYANGTKWDEHFIRPVCTEVESILLTLWDKNLLNSRKIGSIQIFPGAENTSWRKDGLMHFDEGVGCLEVKVVFTPASHSEGLELHHAYFPMYSDGELNLYQDAESSALGGRGLFHDIADSFRRARRFIYIAGWSVWSELRMERENDEILGNILKQKASEGVKVLLLLWDEKFSAAGMCAGLVGTYDTLTSRFFEGSGVHVEKVHRMKSSVGFVRKQLVEVFWSHHQKLVVVDDEDDVVAYLGGIDLTRGRWDTPLHPLFSSLKGDHQGDFYNGFLGVQETEGPREPYHDVHARVTGGAARSVRTNFEERWKGQVPEKVHLLLGPDSETKPSQRETNWRIQIVRSIDNNSSVFWAGNRAGLDVSRGVVVDTSLHHAAVRLIRRANSFIYIESQYFIGSSLSWEENSCVDADNLVPLEIAHKVVSKIRSGEDFRVYLVMPLLPEGRLTNPVLKCSVKSILRWQHLTLQMMYSLIAGALKDAGSDKHPMDYLLVLSLVKHEQPTEESKSEWGKRGKFVVYVHSKLLLADDSTVLLGSANLNQRSLCGSRDTEIAVCAAQVDADGKEVNSGPIKAFRKALWAEHTGNISEEPPEGETEKEPWDPSSLQTMRRMRSLAQDTLRDFKTEQPQDQRNRFMLYPISVSLDGRVQANMETLPHFPVPVLGSRGFLPSKINV